MGLSVDVYSPDLYDLITRFERVPSRPAYLEIFRATTTALQGIRHRLVDVPLAYHGEGLWITQPEFSIAPFLDEELDEVASQLNLLASPWLNHECATKQMSGYSFGTYLPPLYTVESAALVANNVALVQERLDERRMPGETFGPLFLLEVPPLTYFMAGTLTVQEYFRLVTQRTPCGLVLDVGHLWTVYRYSAGRRHVPLEQFIDQFLDEFPMERVIEIHIAGLAAHEAQWPSPLDPDPYWIDAHAAPIPEVSWALLERILAHPRLLNLRAVALEVDTKPIELIVAEFSQAASRVGRTVERLMRRGPRTPSPRHEPTESGVRTPSTDVDGRHLANDYVQYARIASGQQAPEGPSWEAVAKDSSGLERYTRAYLPHEILHWGGELTDMFPETCKALHDNGVPLHDFVAWWFHLSRPADGPYDFFLLKIDRLVEFVGERAPALLEGARREADALRVAYEQASIGTRRLREPCR